MDQNLLTLFKNIYDKQSELSKITDLELFTNFSNSEIHTIDLIHRLDLPNGAKISEELGLTPGAVSKIIKKLKAKSLLTEYMLEDNKKERYYSLTEEGFKVFKAHEKAHKDWELRELEFFKNLDTQEKEVIQDFLSNYNKYLGKLIEERTK